MAASMWLSPGQAMLIEDHTVHYLLSDLDLIFLQ